MLKKVVIYGLIGVIGWNAVKNTKLGSYIRSEVTAARKAAEDATTPERDLNRLKAEIKLLDRDIQALITPLAKEVVNVKQTKEQIAEFKAKQSQAKELLQARAAAIKSATDFVTFGDRSLPVQSAKAALEDGVKQYTNNQKSLEAMEATLSARERIKDTLEKQLDTLKTQRLELATAVDALEAEVVLLKLQQMESRYQTDGTRLARVKESLRDLKTKVAVHREELKLLPSVLDTSSTTPASATKSVDDIIAPLNTPTKANKGDTMPPAID